MITSTYALLCLISAVEQLKENPQTNSDHTQNITDCLLIEGKNSVFGVTKVKI